ncbi:Murein DD-endopeptidase MepS/Murein LD-carboxypeptidase precursor [compost metagenome]
MKVTHYRPAAVVEFYTETGRLVAKASNIDTKAYDDDVVSIQTERDMGADAPTFSINLVRRKPWEEWVSANDLITISMWRPPETRAEVMIGLVDDCRKKVVMGEESQRVVTVTGRGVAKAFIQFDVGIVPEVEYQESSIGWLQSNGVILAGKTSAEVLEVFWYNIARKFINYKWSNGKTLFDIMTHKFTSKDGLMLLESATLVNYQGSMWSFIKEIAEAPFHEAYFEIYNGKPHLIVRPTPFSQKDWAALPMVEVTDEEINMDSIGRSDIETYTLFSVGAKTMYSDADVFKTFGVPPLWYKPYADKYGLRRLQVETSYAAVGGGQDLNTLNSLDSLKSLREDLYNWNVMNNQMYNGTMIVRGSNRFKIGYRLKHNEYEYYITRVAHQFVNFGNWVTELGITRGMKPAARFKSPYGAGQEYTGLGLAPYNPSAATAAMQSPSDQLLPISGVYQGKASAVIQGATQIMNSGRIRYVFGGNNFAAGKLDCSSFTQYVYKTFAGIDIGRTTGTQVQRGTRVEKNQLMPGDLVFFKNTYKSPHIYGVSHVGIYIGNNQFIHNSSGDKTVVVGSLNNSYYVAHWLMGRRVLQPEVPSKTMKMVATAYGATKLNGGAGTGQTATGTVPKEGQTIAVDPKVIALGTKVRIESDFPGVSGIYIAEDTGGAIKGNRIDIYFDDLNTDPQVARKKMFAFGKREIKVTILNN